MLLSFVLLFVAPCFSLPSLGPVTPILSVYYPDWSNLSPDTAAKAPADYFNLAFFVFDDLCNIHSDTSEPSRLSRLVQDVHDEGKKVTVTVGGWEGSGHFSQAFATPSNRQRCVDNTVALVHHYKLDGIEIDWEYPDRPGKESYKRSPDDHVAILTAYLQLLRKQLGWSIIIGLAVPDVPYLGPDGMPSQYLPSIAELVTYVDIMNYDILGVPFGPNAPLSNKCGNSSQPGANARDAISNWHASGFPLKKIILALPLYGYTFATDNDNTVRQAMFRDIANDKLVRKTNLLGQVCFVPKPASGCVRRRDYCSSTPELECKSELTTYDDTTSLGEKANLVMESGILGAAAWPLSGDTDQWDLLNSVLHGLTGRRTYCNE